MSIASAIKDLWFAADEIKEKSARAEEIYQRFPFKYREDDKDNCYIDKKTAKEIEILLTVVGEMEKIPGKLSAAAKKIIKELEKK